MKTTANGASEYTHAWATARRPPLPLPLPTGERRRGAGHSKGSGMRICVAAEGSVEAEGGDEGVGRREEHETPEHRPGHARPALPVDLGNQIGGGDVDRHAGG